MARLLSGALGCAPACPPTIPLGILDRMRLDPATAAILAVLCTTAPRELQGLENRQGEGLYLLANPFDLEQLLTILATALRDHPPQRSTR